MKPLQILDYEKERKFICLTCKEEFPLERDFKLTEICKCRSYRIMRLKGYVEVTNYKTAKLLKLAYNGESR